MKLSLTVVIKLENGKGIGFERIYKHSSSKIVANKLPNF
jgi:hypothetical protein